METLLPGISAERVRTSRLTMAVLSVTGRTGQPVLFVHGNVSSSLFWQPTMLALPEGYRPLAVDLRGFGETDPEPVDATRGLGDYADDLAAVIEARGLAPVHLVGWSMGGGVVLQYLSSRPAAHHAASVTLVVPVSPFGFGGTRGAEGTLCDPSGVGSGGGSANPDFVARLASGDQGADGPTSPRQDARGTPQRAVQLGKVQQQLVEQGGEHGQDEDDDHVPRIAEKQRVCPRRGLRVVRIGDHPEGQQLGGDEIADLFGSQRPAEIFADQFRDGGCAAGAVDPAGHQVQQPGHLDDLPIGTPHEGWRLAVTGVPELAEQFDAFGEPRDCPRAGEKKEGPPGCGRAALAGRCGVPAVHAHSRPAVQVRRARGGPRTPPSSPRPGSWPPLLRREPHCTFFDAQTVRS